MTSVDTKAECTLIHGNPEWHSGIWATIDGFGEKTIRVRHTIAHLGIDKIPPAPYEVFISLIPEHIF